MRRLLRPTLALATCTAAVVAAVGVAIGPAGATPTTTTTSGVARVVEAQTDPINAPGQTLTLQRVTIQPHTQLVEHFHQGTQLARILRGRLTFHVVSGSVQVTGKDGRPRTVSGPETVTLQPGDQLVEIPPVVHYGANDTARKVVIQVAALIEQGAPLATPTAPATPTISLTTEINSIEKVLTPIGTTTYGWNHLVGTATLDAQPVLCDILGNVNYVNGLGPFFGFVTFTFADGSQIATQMLGRATQAADGSSHVEAPLQIFAGTGRFAGATGGGFFDGTRTGAVGAPVASSFTLAPVVK
ncbi:MAG: hypothetical protein WCI50_01165 [Actinomycetes bacterium]